MSQTFFQVDSFSNKAFSGNPAAVMILEKPAPASWMQLVAREMNLSETAFVVKNNDEFDLRWFTPTSEVLLCGHATLATAHTLWEQGVLQESERAKFHTKSGALVAERKGSWIEMDFPNWMPTPASAPAYLNEAFRVPPVEVHHHQTSDDILIEVETEEEVRSITPDFSLLKKEGAPCIMVTSPSSNPDFDFVSRYFAPNWGIDEDPVTGSAHCILGPYWAQKLGKTELRAYQASERGGEIHVRVESAKRVFISGQAVTVAKGELLDSAPADGN